MRALHTYIFCILFAACGIGTPSAPPKDMGSGTVYLPSDHNYHYFETYTEIGKAAAKSDAQCIEGWTLLSGGCSCSAGSISASVPEEGQKWSCVCTTGDAHSYAVCAQIKSGGV